MTLFLSDGVQGVGKNADCAGGLKGRGTRGGSKVAIVLMKEKTERLIGLHTWCNAFILSTTNIKQEDVAPPPPQSYFGPDP